MSSIDYTGCNGNMFTRSCRKGLPIKHLLDEIEMPFDLVVDRQRGRMLLLFPHVKSSRTCLVFCEFAARIQAQHISRLDRRGHLAMKRHGH